LEEIMKDTIVTPVRGAAGDKRIRWRAAAAVGKASVGHPLWWLCLVVFIGLSGPRWTEFRSTALLSDAIVFPSYPA
jgi:hypothetical protein